MGRTPNDDRSDSLNPNSDAYSSSQDNRSDQLNPNNERHQASDKSDEEDKRDRAHCGAPLVPFSLRQSRWPAMALYVLSVDYGNRRTLAFTANRVAQSFVCGTYGSRPCFNRRGEKVANDHDRSETTYQSFAPMNILVKLSPQSGATDIRRSATTSARSGPSTSSANSRIRFRNSTMRGVGSGCAAQASSDGH